MHLIIGDNNISIVWMEIHFNGTQYNLLMFQGFKYCFIDYTCNYWITLINNMHMRELVYNIKILNLISIKFI